MKLTGFATTTALTLTLAPAAWAGSMAEAPVEPMVAPVAVVAPAPYDWSGFYVGLSAGRASGDFTYYGEGYGSDPFDLEDGDSLGGFAGYNFQRGNWVYGLELAMQNVDPALEGFPTYQFDTMNDLKARIGYANNNVLFYAFGGISQGDWTNGAFGNFDADGTNMGVGAEMVFWGNWLGGIEYIHRSVDGDFLPGSDETFDSDFGTLQLRVGYKF